MDEQNKAFSLPTQREANYRPLSDVANKACSTCRFFQPSVYDWYSDSSGPACFLVDAYPEPIVPNGVCDRHEPAPDPTDEAREPVPVVIVEGKAMRGIKGLLETLIKGKAAPVEKPVTHFIQGKSGFKSLPDGRWMSWFTNAFEDAEGELFPLVAIDAYIDRLEAGEVPYPELWVEHLPGTKHGQAEWIGRVDKMVLAVGKYDDTPLAQQMKAFYETEAGTLDVSHGFYYPPLALFDGVYWYFDTFEISPLPVSLPANPFASWEAIMGSKMNKGQREFLTNLLGEELVAQIEQEGAAKSAAIEATGRRWKALSAKEEGAAETTADPTAAAEQDAAAPAPDAPQEAAPALSLNDVQAAIAEALTTALTPIIEELAAQGETIKAIKAQQDENSGMAPRASKSAANNVPADHPHAQNLKDLNQTGGNPRDAGLKSMVDYFLPFNLNQPREEPQEA